ncbi:helix-turn-helix transcriptional regulator [Blastococcus sp. TF02-8]|uniref:helix-turn-helix transcriptional regulator n=1 Tax=Blastococcus sp. TF02-8 TaxID=2250574 RepID=UPI000DEA519A|nr:LuxR family transcriptional regulator [Blastococcus sp. TF02-8]RBY95905.1 helix-turn-helix transcriptional regulator [Blastococcus sp. TF02-8]
MLEALGISEQTEAVYLTLLKDPDALGDELAVSLGLPECRVHEALADLARLSLLHPSASDPRALRPVRPEVALQALVARRQAEFARHQQQLAEGEAAVAMLLAEHAERHPPAPARDAEHLEGAYAVESRLRDLVGSSRREICSFLPTEAQLPLGAEAEDGLSARTIQPGVRYRTVFLDSIRNQQPAVDRARRLVDVGGEVRTAPLLPLELYIFDRAHALVPVNPGNVSDATVVSGAGLVTALVALFQFTWHTASPLDGPRRRDANGLCAQRRQVLRLLAAGHTDDAIARRLGVSIRTARRVASDLLNRLDARSRFQAGAQAVARGWLDVDDLDPSGAAAISVGEHAS